jgi:predicted dinucleotide-binding enzyme
MDYIGWQDRPAADGRQRLGQGLSERCQRALGFSEAAWWAGRLARAWWRSATTYAWAHAPIQAPHNGRPHLDAATFGELIINATPVAVSLDALAQARAANLAGKVLLDVANPIDPGASQGHVALSVANTEGLAEQIQHAFPRSVSSRD